MLNLLILKRKLSLIFSIWKHMLLVFFVQSIYNVVAKFIIRIYSPERIIPSVNIFTQIYYELMFIFQAWKLKYASMLLVTWSVLQHYKLRSYCDHCNRVSDPHGMRRHFKISRATLYVLYMQSGKLFPPRRRVFCFCKLRSRFLIVFPNVNNYFRSLHETQKKTFAMNRKLLSYHIVWNGEWKKIISA
jgi:hypothetical protein